MQKPPSAAIHILKISSSRKRSPSMEADQSRACDDDELFSFMARNDVPQEQDLLLLNMVDI